MHDSKNGPPALTSFNAHGPLTIAAGLIPMILSPWLTAMPLVTAMALVALGATEATITRFRSSPNRGWVLAIHATCYAGLYALFVAATLDQIARGFLGGWAAADLALSVPPVVAASRMVYCSMPSSIDVV
ncbi:MAG: hypothetical protein IT425_10345 [Pirellulales bacterium]|nr:hypothetical protein [Pirellulales bacterium]